MGKKIEDEDRIKVNNRLYSPQGLILSLLPRTDNQRSTQAKAIKSYSFTGEYLGQFRSSNEAAREYGITKTNIFAVLYGKVEHTRGYQFRYVEDDDRAVVNLVPKYPNYMPRPVVVYSYSGKAIKTLKDQKEASEFTGVSVKNICLILNSYRKHINELQFRYLDDVETHPVADLTQDTMDASKAIVRLTMQGEFIDEWVSGTVAAKALGLNNRCISYAAQGKLKGTGGFKWMFKSEYLKLN